MSAAVKLIFIFFPLFQEARLFFLFFIYTDFLFILLIFIKWGRGIWVFIILVGFSLSENELHIEENVPLPI